METKTNERKWTVLRNTVGCKISGNFTEEEIKSYIQDGTWNITQID